MIGTIQAELLVLRKRTSTGILLGIWVTLALFFAYVVPYIQYRNNEGTPAQGPLAELLPERLVGTLTGGFPFFGGVITLMLGVLSMGSEYGWGTLKTLFTQRPGRLHVFGAKLLALGIVLVPFVLLVFMVGVASSVTIAQLEGASIDWPSAGLIARGLAGSWFILAVWAAFGVLLAVLSRGTSLAIGIGILYALVIEGLLGALATQISLLDPVIEFFVRANGYSIVTALGASIEDAADRGPGSFSGPFVSGTQAVIVLAVYLAGFILVSAFFLRRRDVT